MVAPLIIAAIAAGVIWSAIGIKEVAKPYLASVEEGRASEIKTKAQTDIIKAEGEAIAISKGTSGATSEDWFWGAFTKQEAYERGKDNANILADSKYKRGSAISGEDTSTGAAGTANKPKTGNDSATAATDSKGFPEISGLITPMVYIGLIILIFMLIKGR